MHNDWVYVRTIELAQYILETRDTVRGAAKKFGISKSTVHKDITERLESINSDLFEEIKKIRYEEIIFKLIVCSVCGDCQCADRDTGADS